MRGYQRTLPFYHTFVIDMVIAMRHGIPASSESRFIHAVNKASSERDGDGDSNPRGGTCQNFDRDARPIFLGLKFGQILFFWVGNFFSYFSGFRKISAIFLGLTNFQLFFWVSQFLYHTLESFK